MSHNSTAPDSQGELRALLSAIAARTEYDPIRPIHKVLLIALRERNPDTFSPELVHLCVRWCAESALDLDALATEAYMVWTDAISCMKRPSLATRSAFAPTRLAIREIYYLLAQAGCGKVEELRVESNNEWLKRSVRQIPAESAMVDGKVVNDFFVLPEDDAIPYPLALNKGQLQEVVELFRAYRYREKYTPSSHDITVGLYRFLNEDSSPRTDWLSKRVENWLASDATDDQVVQELFDSWKRLFEQLSLSDEGDRQFLTRALNLHRAMGSALAAELIHQQLCLRRVRRNQPQL